MNKMKLPAPLLLAALLMACGSPSENANESAAEADPEQMATMDVSIEEAWATDTIMQTPESVLYDKAHDMIYVANIGAYDPENADGDGFISQLSPDGTVKELKWVTGLNDPKGMGLHDNTLYVADLNEIAAIDVTSGKITNTYPVEGAIFLNDITVSSNGKVYITDSNADHIYLLENGQVSTWMDDSTLQGPNGLLIEDGRLLLASAGGGFLAPINLDNKSVEDHWIDDIPSADGIIKTADGDYIVSTWQGEVHYVDPKNNRSQKLLDTKDQEINSADIGYIESQEMLLVPTFNDNRVVAYKVTQAGS